jgi:serine/threonine protein kinase
MAEIFLAREEGAGPEEYLVIKRLLPHVAQHPELVQMFLDEARVAATLAHPNIVNIYNVGAIGDQYFLSMDYLVGLDLTKVCERLWRQQRTIPLNLTVYLILSVLDALHFAHTRVGQDGKALEIVHRDVSPHNIFLEFNGGVKLLDFGVARAANALHHTKTGALVGKIAYMSPEQCRIEQLDARSDLFSLGIVMYELTTGRRLYNSKKLGEFEVLRQICEKPVQRPSEILKGYPRAVEDIVVKVLQKKREERYPSAEQFATALRETAETLELDLSPAMMAEFLQREFASEIEANKTKLDLIKSDLGDELMSWDSIGGAGIPSGAPPSMDPIPSKQLLSGQSGGIPTPQPEPANDGDLQFDSEQDQTRRRDLSRGAKQRKVEWRRVPSPTVAPQEGSGSLTPVPVLTRSRDGKALVIVAGFVAAVLIALVLWLI